MDYESSLSKEQLDLVINRFISISSHKILSPLTVIKWTTELIEQDPTLSPETIEKIKVINENIRHLEDFAHVILAVSDLRNDFQHDKGVYEIRIEDIINHILFHYEGLIKAKKLGVDVKYNGIEKLLFSIDDKFLLEIFEVLLQNAFYYTEDEGSVSILLNLEGDNLKVEIIDNGVGIPEGERGLLFTPFFRTSNSIRMDVKGTGIGLYYVKSILDRVQGVIEYKPNDNKGSIFTVKIPVKFNHD